jgi:hypothetical protein
MLTILVPPAIGMAYGFQNATILFMNEFPRNIGVTALSSGSTWNQ